MSEIGVSPTSHTIKVNVVQVGKERTFVEVENAADLLAKLGGSSKTVSQGGQAITPDSDLAPESTVYVAPKSVKQGR